MGVRVCALWLLLHTLVAWTPLEGRRLRHLRWRGSPPRPTLLVDVGDRDSGGVAAARAGALVSALAAAAALWETAGVAHGLRFVAATPGRRIVVRVLRGPWPYGAAELARTIAFDDGEGGLCGAHIVLRADHGGPWQPVLAHELGHALGLGHSRERGALMAAGLPAGVTVAALAADDLYGLQALYPPPARTAAAHACTPRQLAAAAAERAAEAAILARDAVRAARSAASPAASAVAAAAAAAVASAAAAAAAACVTSPSRRAPTSAPR